MSPMLGSTTINQYFNKWIWNYSDSKVYKLDNKQLVLTAILEH